MAEPDTRPRDVAHVPANSDRSFPGYPEGYVLAAFDDPAKANEAIARVGTLGINAADIVKYAGAEGARILDSDGSHHGLFAMFERAVEWVMTDEDHLAQYEERAKEGATVVGVHAPDEQLRHGATDVLLDLGATDVKHFGKLQVEVIRR